MDRSRGLAFDLIDAFLAAASVIAVVELNRAAYEPLDVGSLSQPRVHAGASCSMANNSPDGGESMQGLAEMTQTASQPRTSDHSDWKKRDLFRGPAVMGTQGRNRRKYPPNPLNPLSGDEQLATTRGCHWAVEFQEWIK